MLHLLRGRLARLSWRVLAPVALALFPAPAWACLSCGCGGTGASADLGVVGGAASLFSMGNRWLIQQGVAVRGVTGSLNELGAWSPTPTGGALGSLVGTLGVTYFPAMGTSLSLQLPMVANVLDKASWGAFGSVAATDQPRQSGLALGDVGLQGAYTLYEGPSWALAAWGGASLPSGNAGGEPVRLSGAGVFSGQAGAMAIAQAGPLELVGNLGYQLPLGTPPSTASSFYLGRAWLYQLQANWAFAERFRAGLGVNGFAGRGVFGASAVPVPMSKLKLVPSLQWDFAPRHGVRLALGSDLPTLGASAMTDVTAYAVFYQFFR